jgi:hypothetical protein
MEHTRELLAPTGILRGLTEDELRRLLHEETIVVEFAPREAKRSLPKLVRTTADRRRMHALLDALHASSYLDERQRALVAELRHLMPLPGGSENGARRAPRPGKPAARTRKGPRPSARTRGSVAMR